MGLQRKVPLPPPREYAAGAWLRLDEAAAYMQGATTRFPGVQSLGDGMYRLRAKVTNPKTGQPKEIDQIKTAASALEASRIRAELIDEAKVERTQQERQRLATFSLSWIKSKKSELKTSTFERYTRTLAHHIIPHLGDHFVDALTHQDVVRWRDAQKAKPHRADDRALLHYPPNRES